MADVALVCGGSGALGGAIVEALRARGDDVVAAGRETADLRKPEEVDALWERLAAEGRSPRWVVNAAGAFGAGNVSGSDPASLQRMLDVNLGTAWWSCRAAAERLPAGGAIVNVSARAALSGGKGSAAYAVAKAAVVRMTEVLALELADRRVRVNAILPSLIDTPANRAQGLAGGVPPGELASVVAFLLSDDAAAVTGAAIPVYGWT